MIRRDLKLENWGRNDDMSNDPIGGLVEYVNQQVTNEYAGAPVDAALQRTIVEMRHYLRWAVVEINRLREA